MTLKAKTLKLIEENIDGNLHDIGFDNDFMCMTLQAQTTKEK